MTRGVALRQGPFFTFFVKLRSHAVSKSPQRHRTPHDSPSFLTVACQSGGVDRLCRHEALHTDAICGDLKRPRDQTDCPPEIKPDARCAKARKLYEAIGSGA
jgi:hypothetical protein